MSILVKSFTDKIEEIFLNNHFPRKVAVAVSGGSDSLALTLLLHEFCLVNKIELYAVTVDHKLRSLSSIEAKEVGKVLKKRKIFHQILTISSKNVPKKNIESKLRELRYSMLFRFCQENEIEFLFLGHQIGDIAENFLIRVFRGSGLDGLSTMAEISDLDMNFLPCSELGEKQDKMLAKNSSNIDKIKIVRPLLNFEKNELRDFLEQKKVKWFEDETNFDERFLRNKVRSFFYTLPERKLIERRIKNATDEIAKMRDFFDNIVLHEAKKILKLRLDGSFLVDHGQFQKLDIRVAQKILALILMEVGRKDYKPRLEKLKNFYQYLQNDEIKLRNFYGCMAKKFDKKNFIIFAEKPTYKRGELKTILKKIFNN